MPRNKSIEFNKMPVEGGFTFSCTLRASQANLLGMGLSCLPAVSSFQDVANLARQTDAPAKVTRTFSVTVSPRAYHPPRRTIVFCSWMLWFVTTASAAALVAFGVPMLRGAMSPKGSLLRGRARAASLDRSVHWSATDIAAGPFDGATADVAWRIKDAGGKLFQPLATLLREGAHDRWEWKSFEPEALAAYAASAGRTLEEQKEAMKLHRARIEQHIASPFAYPADEADEELADSCMLPSTGIVDHVALPSGTACAPTDIPAPPLAAIALAGAVAEVLGSCIEERTADPSLFADLAHLGVPAAASSPSTTGSGCTSAEDDAGCAYLASCVKAPEPLPSTADDNHVDESGVVDVDKALLAARLAMYTYHSCQGSNATEAESRLVADLKNERLSLVGNVHGNRTLVDDFNAYVAANSSNVVVVFRGSCSLKNAITDIQYHDDGQAVRVLEAATGMVLPTGMRLHRGFVNAYLSVRDELIGLVRAEARREAQGTTQRPVMVTGHSMGGAMAMLAAYELAYHQRQGDEMDSSASATGADESHETLHGIGRVSSMVFGCPRVGDATWARLFGVAFPKDTDHCALQASSDAIPHLPFMSWGFRHPAGCIRLAPWAPTTPRRVSDPGDTVEFLRPRAGELWNWVTCHDLNEYVALLQGLSAPTDGRSTSPQGPSVDAVPGGGVDDAEWGI